jgi:hypothetical protein
MSQKVYRKSFYITKRAIRYITGLKQTDSCRGRFNRLKTLTLYSLYIYVCMYVYIYETVLFVREKVIVRQIECTIVDELLQEVDFIIGFLHI